MKLQITAIHGWKGTTPESEAIQIMQSIMESLCPSVVEDGEGLAHFILGSTCGPGTGMNRIPARAATYWFSDLAPDYMSVDDLEHVPEDVKDALNENTPFYQLDAKFV